MADAAEVKTEEPVEREGEGETKKEKKEKKPKGKAAGKSGAKGQGKGKSTGPYGGGQGYRLNVKNLGQEDEEELKGMFTIFGNVVDAQVKTREDGKSKGFGFVIFATEEEAMKAMAEMNDKEHNGKKLYVAPAERRPEGEGQVMGKGAGKGKGYGADPLMSLAMQQHQQQLAMWQYQQYYALAMMQQQMMGYDGGYSANDTLFPPAAAAGAWSEGEYEGSIKSIGKEGKYAFIVCAETHASYNRDVYLKSDLFPPGMKAASRIKFTVVLSDKNHPQAATCRMAG